MSVYLRKQFWLDAAERGVRAFATSSLTILLSDRVVGILDVDLHQWLSFSGLAVVVSVLTSIAGAKVGDDSASFVSK